MTFGERVLELGKQHAAAIAEADAGGPNAGAYEEIAMHLEALIVAHTEENDLRKMAYNAAQQRNALSYSRCERELSRVEKEIDEFRAAIRQCRNEIRD